MGSRSPTSTSSSLGVRLTWPGRRWREDPPPHQEERGGKLVIGKKSIVETIGVEKDVTCVHRLIHGDGLEVLRSLHDEEKMSGKVDMVYVDPPYASDRDYTAEARLDGPADGRATRTHAYGDRWSEAQGGVGAYLEMLAPRLEALANLLSPRGTFWVHLDWRAAYLVRAILDEIMGRDAFKNEIVWRRAPNLGRQAASGQFGRTLDTIIVYGREKAIIRPPTRLEPIEESAIRWDDAGRPFTSAPRGDYTDLSIAKLDLEGRIHRTSTGRVYIKYFLVKNADGVLCRERRVDALWTDVAPLRHAAQSERTGYPTQKPRALLERIIQCATEPGATVIDGFAGSGTTAVAAHALGRRAILIDASPVAIATARARLLREKAPLIIERMSTSTEPKLDNVKARVMSEAGGGPNNHVRLLAPTEPLAWAVGACDASGVFKTAWHAERVPGAKPTPASLDAHVPRGTHAKDQLRARVFADDGSVGEWAASS